MTTKMNTTEPKYTLEQRKRALKLHNLYRALLSSGPVRTWAAMEEYILSNHTCPDPGADERVQAWRLLAWHPFFDDCYQAEGSLISAMLAKLDDIHAHTCAPTWRSTTADEIQPGWEIRSRYRSGVEAAWGVAHRKGCDGDWNTEKGRVLTNAAAGWTCETTAPAPAPEPWPDEAVDCLEDALIQRDVKAARPSDARALLDALAAKFPGVRDAIKEGEQS